MNNDKSNLEIKLLKSIYLKDPDAPVSRNSMEKTERRYLSQNDNIHKFIFLDNEDIANS